ncbi:O-antigen ligase family protein [Flavivirga amylovorans]|uniref:O-antigen ligase family protein n=1 Tax=Flavivirga amylovorans TaxID=870486 RepID=A0ABT8WXK9_9FLAO|nr:O-antigen ligase family protein [Flavivirga amylovorans]MDO5986398.1 O-antigen ligase family protein [Flavivirga amylovorans]
MLKGYYYINQIILHVGIGLGVYFFKPASKVLFLIVLGICAFSIIKAPPRKRYVYVLSACAYIVGSEVFFRMTSGNFLHEASKYLVVVFLLIGMLIGDGVNKKGYAYIIYLIFLIPGIIVASSSLNYDTNLRTAIAFNLSGPVCLGITALYCYGRKISIKSLQEVLMYALLPIISTTTYLFLYSPTIKDTLSGTQSNFEASGGYGPNQVSTILGLGVFLLAGRLFLQSKALFIKVINIGVLAFMTYRAIVTFSRGGVFVAFLIILAFIITFYFKASSRSRRRIFGSTFVLGIGVILTWFVSSASTYGLIDKRYNNEDALGRTKDDITTGRAGLLTNELNEFFENPFFGVGVGKLKELRLEKEGINAASHNEMSRIIAEHGIFGFVAFLILLLTPLLLRFRNKKNIYFYSFYLFWFLTINHSSMRIAAPAFIYGLCLLNVYYDKPSLHRKQVIKQRKE